VIRLGCPTLTFVFSILPSEPAGDPPVRKSREKWVRADYEPEPAVLTSLRAPDRVQIGVHPFLTTAFLAARTIFAPLERI